MNDLQTGEKALFSGRFPEACTALGQWVGSHPQDGPARAKLSLALFEDGRESKAFQECEEALARLSDGHPVGLLCALAYLAGGRTVPALAIVEKVKALDPANPFAAGLTALARLGEGQAASALAIFDASGVFELPLFRAHLLEAVETWLSGQEKPAAWQTGYLKTVL